MVTQHRFCAFGAIVDGKMNAGVIGEMIGRWWHEIGNVFPGVTPGDFVIMPNHFHGIIIIADSRVGADLRVRPNNVRPNDSRVRPNDPRVRPNDPIPGIRPNDPGSGIRPIDSDFGTRPNDPDSIVGPNGPAACAGAPFPVNDAVGHADPGAHAGAPLRADKPSLSRIVQWFKTMTTNEYIRGVKQYAWPEFPGHFWQRNYHEHVIRDDADSNRIRQYIANNPAQWDRDRFHVDPVGADLRVRPPRVRPEDFGSRVRPPIRSR